MLKRNKLFIIVCIILLVATAVFYNIDAISGFFSGLSDLQGEGQLAVYFLDVGQADCALMVSNDCVVMIDCGNDADGQFISEYLNKLSISTIDYLILTHPHEDHIGGADIIMDNFDIGEIYMTKCDYVSKNYYEVLNSANVNNYTVIMPKPKDKISEGMLTLEFIAPNGVYSDVNEMSLVVKAVYGNNTFLFTGDAGAASEADIIELEYDIKADLLKVGHHGSNGSSGKKFLEGVAPEYAVISCGENNSYGHPHQNVLERLSDAGCEVYRTDVSGNIIAISDGNDIVIKTDRLAEEYINEAA